jgi:hypothetical protein
VITYFSFPAHGGSEAKIAEVAESVWKHKQSEVDHPVDSDREKLLWTRIIVCWTVSLLLWEQ